MMSNGQISIAMSGNFVALLETFNSSRISYDTRYEESLHLILEFRDRINYTRVHSNVADYDTLNIFGHFCKRYSNVYFQITCTHKPCP